MREFKLKGLAASNPLGFLAALGTLRVVESTLAGTTLSWVQEGEWHPVVHLPEDADPFEIIWADVERWREGHPAIDFARGADRKIQDLKHPPEAFRELMRVLAADLRAEPFVAAYATGVIVDGTGQTKPTALHFTAGQQRFMDPVLETLDIVTKKDIREALGGPWEPVEGKNLRWRAASERSRALLSYDPGKEKSSTVPGAVWLAFQGLPLLPVAPGDSQVVTTGFTGRARSEAFTWPVWTDALTSREAQVTLGLKGLGELPAEDRRALGVAQVFRAEVVRSSQGYGNFSAARPV